ncbi:MAG TPA: P-loop NTPase [Thermoleophilaceae bacterium]|nr:P-loop NTPase [Thermoleophilaceae bacterium]
MSGDLKAIVGLDGGVDLAAFQSLLEAQPGVSLACPVGDLSDAWDALDETICDLVVIGCGGDGERALSFIAAAVKERPQVPIVVAYQGTPNGFVNAAFEAGADEVLMLPAEAGEQSVSLDSDVLFTFQKALARRNGAPSASAQRHSQMICVLGAKGGIGKTVVASNLAVALASEGASVALVDLNLQCGDLALALGLQPNRTIYDLATSGGALDAEKLEAFLGRHESGVRVLMAPTRPDQSSSVTTDFLDRTYSLLRAMHDYVIVDTPPGFTPEVIASIDGASDVCMVAALDVLSLKSARVGLETLRLMGYDLDRVRLVLNRADSRVGLDANDVTAIVGGGPDVLVPSHRDITRTLNEAKPIVTSSPRSEAARAFKKLARLYEPVAQSNGNGAANGRRRLRRKGR